LMERLWAEQVSIPMSSLGLCNSNRPELAGSFVSVHVIYA
jgi:hypothetical protein